MIIYQVRQARESHYRCFSTIHLFLKLRDYAILTYRAINGMRTIRDSLLYIGKIETFLLHFAYVQSTGRLYYYTREAERPETPAFMAVSDLALIEM